MIGFAGTDEKCQLLINKYGFDKAYNYKKVSKLIILNFFVKSNAIQCAKTRNLLSLENIS